MNPMLRRAARQKAGDADRAAREPEDALQAQWDAMALNFRAGPQAERDELVSARECQALGQQAIWRQAFAQLVSSPREPPGGPSRGLRGQQAWLLEPG